MSCLWSFSLSPFLVFFPHVPSNLLLIFITSNILHNVTTWSKSKTYIQSYMIPACVHLLSLPLMNGLKNSCCLSVLPFTRSNCLCDPRIQANTACRLNLNKQIISLNVFGLRAVRLVLLPMDRRPPCCAVGLKRLGFGANRLENPPVCSPVACTVSIFFSLHWLTADADCHNPRKKTHIHKWWANKLPLTCGGRSLVHYHKSAAPGP